MLHGAWRHTRSRPISRFASRIAQLSEQLQPLGEKVAHSDGDCDISDRYWKTAEQPPVLTLEAKLYNPPANRRSPVPGGLHFLSLQPFMMKILGVRLGSLGVSLLNVVSATAQNMTYGADNFYRSNNVTVWPITFPTQYQTTVAGNLFLPNDLDTAANNSAIIVGHPMGAVKEQSANLYATKMAEQGFVAVSLDLPFWGSSEGEPRNAVAPELYAEGFSAAVDYLGTRDFVDRERIGAIGICGSGSFVLSAAKIDPRITAIATSSMYDMGAVNRNGLRHTQSVDQRKEIIAAAARQRWVEASGGEIEYTGGTPQIITNRSTEVDREFYDFYRTSRGLFTPATSAPNLTTHPTLSSNTKFMNFYPFNDIDTISPRPLLFISGDKAHSREFSEDAYALASEPKELFWVPGAGHTDLYDRVDLIPFSKFVDFFQTHLVDN